MFRLLIILGMGFLVIGFAQAQTADCPMLVQIALDTVAEVCAPTSRNELCYGNIHLSVSPRDASTSINFDNPGDLVDLNQVGNIQLSTMDVNAGTWGISLMKIQANMPETLPGQNVTMILFGDVQVQPLGDEVPRVAMTATAGVNVRRGPNTTSNNIFSSLKAGQSVTATGRLSDDTWIRVLLDDGTAGWVAAEYLAGDSSTLDAVSAGDFIVYGPMQSFIFQSDINVGECLEAPSSGILVQTPEGAGKVNFLVNGVEIKIGSTVYMQAVPGDYLTVYVLEGQVILTVDEQSQVVPAGTRASVPLDGDGIASGAPEKPQPYTTVSVQSLPVRLLPEQIRITSPLSEDEIQQALLVNGVTATDTTTVTTSPSGTWGHNKVVTANTCDPEKNPVGVPVTNYITITFSEDRSSLFFDYPGWDSWTFYRQSETVYVSVTGNTMVQTITFTSPRSYFMTHRGDYGGCLYYEDANGTLGGP